MKLDDWIIKASEMITNERKANEMLEELEEKELTQMREAISNPDIFDYTHR